LKEGFCDYYINILCPVAISGTSIAPEAGGWKSPVQIFRTNEASSLKKGYLQDENCTVLFSYGRYGPGVTGPDY
jgi:hypothetical protein